MAAGAGFLGGAGSGLIRGTPDPIGSGLAAADIVLSLGAAALSDTPCFVAGTLVTMADGSKKPIEQVKAGDQVLSCDAKTNRLCSNSKHSSKQAVAKRVVRTFVHKNAKTLVLHLTNGESIITTPKHPFYVEGRGFVAAGHLAIGNSIVTRAGPSVQVATIEWTGKTATVYNFEVSDFHTYFVGSSYGGLWVHNDCSGGGGDGEENGGGGGGGGDGSGDILVRRGAQRESLPRLSKAAQQAEDGGFPHGVSVTTPESNARLARDPTDAVSAPRDQIEAGGFPVHSTPTRNDPNHHTVELPKPLTQGDVDRFNKIFRRR